jgi:CheY-like chemotaxis protein
MMTRQILLIDDDDDIREVVTLSLREIGGWDVVNASSGEEGLKKAEQVRPDAILLDVMMPEMDGPTTFQKLRANSATSDIPVILLTAKVQAADQRRFTRLGVEGLISKPFDPLQLAAQVAATLGWRN